MVRPRLVGERRDMQAYRLPGMACGHAGSGEGAGGR